MEKVIFYPYKITPIKIGAAKILKGPNYSTGI